MAMHRNAFQIRDENRFAAYPKTKPGLPLPGKASLPGFRLPGKAVLRGQEKQAHDRDREVEFFMSDLHDQLRGFAEVRLQLGASYAPFVTFGE